MGIFITDNDNVECSFFTGSVSGDFLCFDTEAEAREKLGGSSFEKHIIVFKKMSYGTMKKIQNSSTYEADGKLLFNAIKFRSERFFHSIKQWSFKDSAGNPVPITQQAIDNMSENVANFLIDLYEKKMK
jgi:hypothetical protein